MSLKRDRARPGCMPHDLTREALGQVSQRNSPCQSVRPHLGPKKAKATDRAPAPLLLMQVSQQKRQQGA